MPTGKTLTTDATRQLTDLRSQQTRLIDAYQAGVISLRDLEARRRPITDRIGELEQLARHAEHHRLSQAELKQRIDDFASEVTDGLAAMDFARRQQLARTVPDKVVVSESRVEILFKIPLPGAQKEGRSPATRVSRLRPERQNRAKTRLPLGGAPEVLHPAHRRRTDLRHRQRPRQQQHRPRLDPGSMGLAPLMLWLACLMAVRNQRILTAWTARQDDNTRRAAAGATPDAAAGTVRPSPTWPPRARHHRPLPGATCTLTSPTPGPHASRPCPERAHQARRDPETRPQRLPTRNMRSKREHGPH